jgi:hypothetical protein
LAAVADLKKLDFIVATFQHEYGHASAGNMPVRGKSGGDLILSGRVGLDVGRSGTVFGRIDGREAATYAACMLPSALVT